MAVSVSAVTLSEVSAAVAVSSAPCVGVAARADDASDATCTASCSATSEGFETTNPSLASTVGSRPSSCWMT